MKKLLVVLFLLITVPVFAQQRGLLKNQFASWYTVTSTQTTISLPYESRDISIHNGGSTAVCVDLKGGTIGNAFDCISEGEGETPSEIFIDGDTTLEVSDYATSSISLKAGSSASPVTVVVTY